MDSQPAPITNGGETAVDLRSRFRAAFFSVAPAMFLGSIDQTIVAAALPVIARSFGGLALTTWVVTGYLLAATVAAPIYGRLGDALAGDGCCYVPLACFWLARSSARWRLR